MRPRPDAQVVEQTARKRMIATPGIQAAYLFKQPTMFIFFERNRLPEAPHKWGGQPGEPGLPARRLNGDRCSVELGESKAAEGLVVGGPLITQDTDCDCLTE
jgi:hypothetical protein